jgi:DNA-binding LacI/PurR family transcriptional regulator
MKLSEKDRMPPHSATISDVARAAGVSISTVSRVLNGTVPVEPETAERVRVSVARLNYFPRAAARTLASKRTNTIGLLLYNIGGEFYTPLLRGIEAACNAGGYDLLIHSTHSIRSGASPRTPLGEHNTDGLLVFTGALDGNELTRLAGIGFPLVLLHQSPPMNLHLPSVTIENRQGARQMVEHLIEIHGRKRIIFLRGPAENEDSAEREKGYRQALKNRHLPFDPELIAAGGFEPGLAFATLQELLRKGLDFDAIFTGDDDNAVGVIQALREAGKKIPQDVAVAGFDDSLFARILVPPLTTVHAPIEEVGRQGTNLLIRKMRGENVETKITLPVQVVIRQSCGCQ